MCLQPSKQSSVYREKLSKLPTLSQMPHKDNQRQTPGSNAPCHSLWAPSLIPSGSTSEAYKHQTNSGLLLPHPVSAPLTPYMTQSPSPSEIRRTNNRVVPSHPSSAHGWMMISSRLFVTGGSIWSRTEPNYCWSS